MFLTPQAFPLRSDPILVPITIRRHICQCEAFLRTCSLEYPTRALPFFLLHPLNRESTPRSFENLNTHAPSSLSISPEKIASLTSHASSQQTEEGKAQGEQNTTPSRRRIYTDPVGSFIIQRDSTFGSSIYHFGCNGVFRDASPTK